MNLSGPDKLKKFRAGADALKFGSHSVYVVDEFSSDVLFEKDAELVVTGLSSQNVASARDLSRLIVAAHAHPAIARYSTDSRYSVNTGKRRLDYVNSNRLIGAGGWDIKLQKTGYITEAGRCLVMKVTVGHRPVIMVLLNSNDHATRFADARRLRDWVRDVREFDTAVQVRPQPGPG